MRYFPTRVETKDNIARWKIDRSYQSFDSSFKQQPLSVQIWRFSDVFKIGNWEWQLSLCKPYSTAALFIGLDPVVDEEDKENPSPVMLFTITVVCSQKIHNTSCIQVVPGDQLRRVEGTCIKQFRRDNVMWCMTGPFTGKFTVIVTFNDMKITNPWAKKRNKKQGLLASVSRMLSENIYSDVTINTLDGVKIGAHRAILGSRSPVFYSMFSHDFQKKEHSTINITDMSTKACQVFFKYIYGNMEQEELVEHRLELLSAADKYDVPQLKEVCGESFVEDIDRKNVVQMLQTAYTYGLPKLKKRCMEFLVKSGNVFEMQDEFNELLESGDRDLIVQIFHEILKDWKSCRDEIDVD